MKQDLAQLLKGNNLRCEIYQSVSRHKFGSTTRLRNTLNTNLPKYLQFKSEGHQIKTQIASPQQKTENSLHKLSKSVNDTWNSKRSVKKSGSKSKECKLQRSQHEHSKSKTHKNKSKSQILSTRKTTSQQGHYPQPSQTQNFIKVQKKSQKNLNVLSNKEKKHKKSNIGDSSFKSSKQNLESIIEQSSSQQKLITPDHKYRSKENSPSSQSRTKKKEKNDLFSTSFRRKLYNSFKEPEISQKLLKHEWLTVSYRILKRRLIEIQVYSLKHLSSLSVRLQKGNLQCQSITESYKHTAPNTIMSLFSAVRSVDIDHINQFPQLVIEASCQEEEQNLQRTIMIPYTWLHFVQQKLPYFPKSKIKTKLCLSNLNISSANLRVLSEIFLHWVKKNSKGLAEYETGFVQNEHDFTLRLMEEGHERFSLEVQGKGEERLTRMIQFLQCLIC